MENSQQNSSPTVPWFGARRLARRLITERDDARAQLSRISEMGEKLVAEVKSQRAQLERLGVLSAIQLEAHRQQLEKEIVTLQNEFHRHQAAADAELADLKNKLSQARSAIVITEETALLQEAGVYKYRHPLTDVVAYENRLSVLESEIKAMNLKDGGAILADSGWTVNGSASEGRAMIRDYSKLMLRAFNAEADNLVRTLKPYKLDAALERLRKVAETIAKLGRRMNIRISAPYQQLRARELELTADYLHKDAEEKENERKERERLREEKKVQQEIEREKAKLEKERQHNENVLAALLEKGDHAAAARVQSQLQSIDENMKAMDYRAANIRAGYVYVISNIGSFGEHVVKIGMTRRLDPMDRIRELSDASVPFNFDLHALHFSNDAVGIESAMHDNLATSRINTVNQRREFFRVSLTDVKGQLSKLAGEMLQFQEFPEALEYRQSAREKEKFVGIASPAAI